MRFIILTTALLLAAPATAKPAHTTDFYVLMRDSGSAKMLILDSVDGGPTNTSVVVLDVFSDPKTALMQTLEFNCPKRTFASVAAISMTPDGRTSKSNARRPGGRIPDGSQLAFVRDLVCAGKGNLERDKVIRGTVPGIIQSYWGK